MAPTYAVPGLFVRPQLTLYVPLFGSEVNWFEGTWRSQVQFPASARNFFVHLQNRTRIKGREQNPFDFFEAF